MFHPLIAELCNSLVLQSSIELSGDRARLYRRIAANELVEVTRGIYIDARVWASLDATHRYLALVAAVTLREREPPIFSHESAAALWKLPWVGQWPQRVHVTQPVDERVHSSSLVFRHVPSLPLNPDQIGGVSVTTLARTVVDLSRRLPMGQGVVLADAALRRTRYPVPGLPRTFLTPDDLRTELEHVPLRHGLARARLILGFADGRADRPGESLSRVTMFRAGISMPRLQVEMYGASGKRYVVDFWWPEFNVIGEFDGVAKYKDPEFLRGRAPEQALLDEKRREDDLRATGKRFARWGWSEASSIPRLSQRLAQAGVR
jgi:hypothetical protein